jgi:hypothetical protein
LHSQRYRFSSSGERPSVPTEPGVLFSNTSSRRSGTGMTGPAWPVRLRRSSIISYSTPRGSPLWR